MRPVGPLSTNAGSILSSVRRWCYGASVSVAYRLLRTAWKSRFLFGLDLPFATAASFFCGPILGKSEYRFRSHIELALLCDETYYYAIWTDCQLEPDCRGVTVTMSGFSLSIDFSKFLHFILKALCINCHTLQYFVLFSVSFWYYLR